MSISALWISPFRSLWRRLDAGHDLILFRNSSDEEFDESMRTILPLLEEDD